MKDGDYHEEAWAPCRGVPRRWRLWRGVGGHALVPRSERAAAQAPRTAQRRAVPVDVATAIKKKVPVSSSCWATCRRLPVSR